MNTKRFIKKALVLFMCVVMFATMLPTSAHAANLATPNLTKAYATASGIKVKWDAVSGADMYRVFRKTSSGWTVLGDVSKTYYVDANVKSGKTYTYTVRCVSNSGKYQSSYNKSGISATWSDTVLDAPELIYAKSVSGGIAVKWVTTEGIPKYRIFRKSGSGSWKTVGYSTSNTYKDTSVKSGNTYTYTVRCVNGSGNVCSESDHTGITATYIAYATPEMVSAVAGTDSIVVKWKAVSGAPKYQVFRKIGTGSWTKIAKTTDTSYTDTTINAGELYHYTVRVCDNDGTLLSSYEYPGVSATYAGKAEISSISSAPKGVSLEWKTVSGVATYTIYRKSGSGSWTKIDTTTATSYVDKSAVSGTTYTYMIRGKDSSNKWIGAYDSTGKTITFYAPPHLISAVRDDTGIRVTWDAVEGISQYRVFRKIDSGKWFEIGDVGATSYLDTGVANNVDATYTVRCLKDGKLCSSYIKAGVTATSQTFHEAPILTGAVPVDGGIKITWQAVDGVSKYQLFRHDTSHTDETWDPYKLVSGTEYVDTNVKKGGKYSYTVACVDSSDVVSSKYDQVGLSATYYPVPTVTSAVNRVNGVIVTWAPVDGIGYYNVYRKTGNGSWTLLASNVKGTSYTDTSAKSTYTYHYSVACVINGVECSAYDDVGKGRTFYEAPKLNSIAAVKNGVKIIWTKVDGLSEYTISRKTGSGSYSVIASGVTGTSYVDTTAVAGKEYTYTVRGEKSGNAVTGSNTGLTIMYYAAPTLVSATAYDSPKKIIVKWKRVTSATYYNVYRKTDTTGWERIAKATTSLQKTDTDLDSQRIYYYTVRVCDANGVNLSGYDSSCVSARAK